jgi:hypothetical protein
MATLSLRHILLSLLLFTLFHPCKSQDNAEQWKVFSLGDPALHINFPGEVIPKETPLPLDLINRLQRFDTFRFYHADGKLVAVMKFTQYNTPIEEPVGALLDTEVTHIMKSIHAEEVLQQEKDFSLHKYPGRKSTGRFMMEQKAYSFQDVLLKKDNSMWQVWVAAEESDPASVKMMKKIVKGIKW